MKITRSNLKRIIETYLKEAPLSEGRRDRDYIENLNISEEDKSLYLEAESQGLKTQEIIWIEKTRDTFDLFHIVQSVLEFKSKEFNLKVKVKSARLNDPSLMSYLNLSSFSSIQELDLFIDNINVDLSSYDRNRFVSLETGDDLEIVGKVGPWTIILPKTIKGSVSCDASTDKDTTWCTTKRSGQNLFYSYAGDENVNVMLFYIMNYNKKPLKPIEKEKEGEYRMNDSRMSLGFVNSKPFLKGVSGGLSVDAANAGIDEEYLRRSLGQYYDEVMSALNSSVQKYGGISPAIETLRKSAQSVEVLTAVIKDYDKTSEEAFSKTVLKQKNVSQEVIEYLSNVSIPAVRAEVALIPTLRPKTLEKLSHDSDAGVRSNIASNPSTTLQILENLSNDLDNDVIYSLCSNPASSPQILEKLSNHPEVRVRLAIAISKSVNPETLEKLSNDSNPTIKVNVARNESVNPETLEKLSKDSDPTVRGEVASFASLNPKTLEKLSNDPSDLVREMVTENPSVSPQILEKLSNDSVLYVREAAIEKLKNRNLRESKRYSLKFLL